MACITHGAQTGSLEFLKAEGRARLLWNSVWCRGSRGIPGRMSPPLAGEGGHLFSCHLCLAFPLVLAFLVSAHS